ncbi:hypothetical protein C0991_010025 [Blastosporella zonata]|nr:hypothetical protein C0991_010025 [Blastosporella zonata]
MPRGNQGTLEAAPMFQEQHNRSHSEVSIHDRYEPTMTSSPGPKDSTRPTYLDTPPMSQANDLPLPNIQYAHVKSNMDQETHLSPNPAGNQPDMNPSPQPSYYSVSELPPQSPLPSPKYKLSTGEITNSPPPPSRPASLATIRAPVLPPSLPHPRAPDTLYAPGAASSPGTYEMQTRNTRTPPNDHEHHYGQGYERSGTSTSYNTAADGYWTADDASAASVNLDVDGYISHRHSSHTSEDDDDRTIGHDHGHRQSVGPSWEGPMVL